MDGESMIIHPNTPAAEQPMEEPLLLLDPGRLKPLPKELWDMPCSACAKLEAKWGFLPTSLPEEAGSIEPDQIEPLTLCSLCFLYASEWGKRRRTEIDKMVVAVEAELTARAQDHHARAGTLSPDKFAALKVTFARDDEGRLTDCKDANRILGAIAISSQIFVSKLEAANAIQDQIDKQRVVLPNEHQFMPKK